MENQSFQNVSFHIFGEVFVNFYILTLNSDIGA